MTDRLVHIRVDDMTIDGIDPMLVIDPVWWRANIYDGPRAYEESLKEFSQPQRFVFAIQWYDAEVCNGGHYQFYSNSTGIVWPDALAGLEQLGTPELSEILLESVLRLGGPPSLNRAERNELLDGGRLRRPR